MNYRLFLTVTIDNQSDRVDQPPRMPTKRTTFEVQVLEDLVKERMNECKKTDGGTGTGSNTVRKMEWNDHGTGQWFVILFLSPTLHFHFLLSNIRNRCGLRTSQAASGIKLACKVGQFYVWERRPRSPWADKKKCYFTDTSFHSIEQIKSPNGIFMAQVHSTKARRHHRCRNDLPATVTLCNFLLCPSHQKKISHAISTSSESISHVLHTEIKPWFCWDAHSLCTLLDEDHSSANISNSTQYLHCLRT